MEKKFRICTVLVFLILAVCAVNVYAVGEPIEQQRQTVPNGMPYVEAQAIANAQQAHIDNMNVFEQGMGVPKQPASVSDESTSPTSEVQSGSTNNAVADVGVQAPTPSATEAGTPPTPQPPEQPGYKDGLGPPTEIINEIIMPEPPVEEYPIPDCDLSHLEDVIAPPPTPFQEAIEDDAAAPAPETQSNVYDPPIIEIPPIVIPPIIIPVPIVIPPITIIVDPGQISILTPIIDIGISDVPPFIQVADPNVLPQPPEQPATPPVIEPILQINWPDENGNGIPDWTEGLFEIEPPTGVTPVLIDTYGPPPDIG
jgi:hypothetical protein